MNSKEIDRQIINLDELDANTLYASDTILVSDALNTSQVVSLAYKNGLCHIIQGDDNKEMELRFSESVVQNKKDFFDDPVQFLAYEKTSSLIGHPIKQFNYIANEKSDKQLCIDKILTDLSDLKLTERDKEACLVVADELIMNIVYDAPKYYEQISDEIKNKKVRAQQSELVVVYCNKYLAFVAIDSYGSIDINKLLSRLDYCYSAPKVILNMNEKVGGAGYGCRMIYDCSISLTIAVDVGVKSIVACIIPYGNSQKKTNKIFKSLHIVNF